MAYIIVFSRNQRVIFHLIYREGNNVAHSIASSCLSSEVSETWDSLFPDWLLNLRVSDLIQSIAVRFVKKKKKEKKISML